MRIRNVLYRIRVKKFKNLGEKQNVIWIYKIKQHFMTTRKLYVILNNFKW